MKVVHVPYCFHPDSVGGSEEYVEALCHELQLRGHDVVVTAPAGVDEALVYKRIPVRRFAVSDVADLSDLYGPGDPIAARPFRTILEHESADLVHVHAFTRSTSLLAVRQAKQLGLPVVFTYHTATVSCRRGTLMRWGDRVCDGVLRVHMCSACSLHGLSLNKGASLAAGILPAAIGKLAMTPDRPARLEATAICPTRR